MRELKFRIFYKYEHILYSDVDISSECLPIYDENAVIMQYTGLKDKNGTGLTEVYEGDIIDEFRNIKGNIYEMDARKTDIVIPQLGTKAWDTAYKEAVVRGFDYSE